MQDYTLTATSKNLKGLPDLCFKISTFCTIVMTYILAVLPPELLF